MTRKILIVEDDIASAAYVAKGLGEAGFVVESCGDGRDGLFLASEGIFDLIVIDRMLPGLDGLRALAIAAVLLFHLDTRWLPGGFLGVDVFFVVSGFLITTLLVRERAATGTVDLPAFWTRRARRLLPALLVCVPASVLLARHPEQRAKLVAERALVPNAVEELLRYEPPSPIQARFVTHDVEWHGSTVPANSRIAARVPAAPPTCT